MSGTCPECEEKPPTASLKSFTTNFSCTLEIFNKIRFTKRLRPIHRRLKEFSRFTLRIRPLPFTSGCQKFAATLEESRRGKENDFRPTTNHTHVRNNVHTISESKGRDTRPKRANSQGHFAITSEPHHRLLRTQRGSLPSEILYSPITHTAQEQSEPSSNQSKTHRRRVNRH